MKRRIEGVGTADGLLGLLALAGFGLFWLALPAQHPDAAADYRLGEEGAIEAAGRFLRESGYTTAGLTPQAAFRRRPDLLDSLQRDLGRPAAVAALKGEAGERLPAYYWHVRWEREQDEGAADEEEEEEEEPFFSVELNEGGAPLAFSSTASGVPVDRAALQYALGGDTDRGPLRSPAPSDSALAASLAFAEGDSLWGRAPAGGLPRIDTGRMVTGLTEGAPVHYQLGPEWAVALARYHLDRSALAPYRFRVDSTWLVRPADGEDRVRTAAVRFVSEAPYFEQHVQADVEVAAAGALFRIDPEFTTKHIQAAGRTSQVGFRTAPDEERELAPGEESKIDVSITARDAAGLISGVTYAVLVLSFLFLFFRRLGARLVDGRAALRDAFWGGLFAGVAMLLAAGTDIGREVPNLWLRVALSGLMGLAAALFAALPIFLASGTTDSIARESWPEKLETWSMARQGLFRNVPMGLVLLRGTALSGCMLGLLTLGLLLFPRLVLYFGDNPERFAYELTLLPVGYIVSYHAYGALFLTLLVLLGAGTLLYRWRPRAAVVVPGLLLLFVLIKAGPVHAAPVGYQWMLSGLTGGVLAAALWRYDALTCFVGYLLLRVLWVTAPGWMADGLPLWLDAFLALILVGAVVVGGLVALLSGRTGEEVPRYVPAYISDLANKERLKRELEIAHQVQSSLMPRRMPRIEGLDVAAMCLAAQEVGGDYYDFIEVEPGRLALVVGDVSGKGIQAAFYMTLIKGFVQTLCRSVASPAEVLRQVNALFYENAPRGTFVSLIYGMLDVEARTFTFARAGHNPVIVKRSPSQEPDLVRPDGMAIGLTPGERFDRTISEVTLHLRPGDVLVFYTDGFSEAMNAAKEQYGDHRLARKVGDVGARSAGEILRAVTEDVHHFLEAVGRHDDMTMIVVKLSRRTDYLTPFGVQKQPAVQA